MVSFHRTLTFRYTALFIVLFVAAEVVIFGALYVGTLALYERRANSELDAEAEELFGRSAKLSVTEMAVLVRERSEGEPGQFREYLLVGKRYEYIEGNVHQWPSALTEGGRRVDMVLAGARGLGVHRVRGVSLPSGCHLLVGRNLSEFSKIKLLIAHALLWTFALTLGVGLLGGYAYSRAVSSRLERFNRGSRAILEGDIGRRMPVSGRGDEYDAMAVNLNRMLDRIEQLVNGLREVTDNIAHDLRKPISRIRSRIELTLMGPADAAAYRETLDGVLDEIGQILRVFNALLTIASAESGLSRERFVRVDLSRIASSTADVYEPVAEEAGLKIRVQAADPVMVQGDPDLIAQAVANLVDNAVKYAAGTGEVTISVARSGASAAITVADRGAGIPPAFREKVLGRFVRLEASRTTEGSGLGLSLVQAVALLHGGRVVLADNAPGLVATIHLPA